MKIKDSPIPLYKQVKKLILDDIKSLEPFSRIGSERDYSKKFNVSRITVRNAFHKLVQEGYLIRIIGKGTYVYSDSESSEFSQTISFTEDMKRYKYYNTHSKVLEFDIINAKQELSNKLKINTGDKVYRLHRLRYIDNTPMTIQDSFIVYDFCPTLYKYDFSHESLYRVLKEFFNLKLTYSNNTLEARISNKSEEQMFGLNKQIPVFILTQTIFIESGKPIEYVKSIYRCDKYKFFNISFRK